LLARGAFAVDVTDAQAGSAAERAQFESAGFWVSNRIVAAFAPDADVAGVIAAACADAGLAATAPFTVERVADRDWLAAARAQFEPIRVSERLWIVPSWAEPPDPNAINLRLDPGLAFGTGSHPTTRMCLRWLDAHLRGAETVIDYGCGSGILAIAAMLLGAAAAVGVDIDPQAVLAARDNAGQNRVAVRFDTPDSAALAPAQIVLANILANPLKLLAPLLAGVTRPGGKLLLSGILLGQAEDVGAAYRPWFTLDLAAEDEGWALLEATRTQAGAAP